MLNMHLEILDFSNVFLSNYVLVFWGILNHLPTFIRTFSFFNGSENCHFLKHLLIPLSLRNKQKPHYKQANVPYNKSIFQFIRLCPGKINGLIFALPYDLHDHIKLSQFFRHRDVLLPKSVCNFYKLIFATTQTFLLHE